MSMPARSSRVLNGHSWLGFSARERSSGSGLFATKWIFRAANVKGAEAVLFANRHLVRQLRNQGERCFWEARPHVDVLWRDRDKAEEALVAAWFGNATDLVPIDLVYAHFSLDENQRPVSPRGSGS